MRVLNNLPLTTLQAHFNEAVITTRAGFHRDSLFPILEVDLPDIAEIKTKLTRRITRVVSVCPSRTIMTGCIILNAQTPSFDKDF